MGADVETTAVAPEARRRDPLKLDHVIAGNPGRPQFGVTVKRNDGSPIELADPQKTRVALALMNMNAVMGGAACHWGGPSGFAEIQAAVHGLAFTADDFRDAYNIINDAGHAENGLYALKANYQYDGLTFEDLKKFRSIESKLSGHGEGHLWPEGVLVSNGPLGSSLPVAQGMAMGDHLAGRERVTVCVISDGAMMEGEAKESVSAIPGFAAKGMVAPFVMVVSDNNTKLSGRIDADAFAMHDYFVSLEAQGWQVIKLDEGNDLQKTLLAVESAMAAARANPRKPVAVWARTIKGFGVQKTIDSASGGHAFPLKSGMDIRAFVQEIHPDPLPDVFAQWVDEIEAAQKAKDEKAKAAGDKPKAEKIQAGFPRAMIAAVADGLPVVSVSSDLPGSTGVVPFHQKHPELSYDCGIAEANMVSTAAGFSKQGFIPVVDTFAQFGTTKGALPFWMANLSGAPVIAVFSHIGFQDAADGASHQAMIYLGIVSGIPHVDVYCPSSSEEAEWAMRKAIDDFAAARRAGRTPNTTIFFVGRENAPVSLRPEGVEYDWGKAMILADTTEGKDKTVAISANATTVSYALQAVDLLAEDGVGVVLINNSTPNKPDIATHAEVMKRCGGRLLCVEDHMVVNGAGAMLLAALNEAGVCVEKTRRLGIQGIYGRSAYKAVELYEMAGFGPKTMSDAAKALLQ